MLDTSVSRRNLVKGAALGAAALGVAAPAALAEEETYTYADTIKWDAQYDVVVVGGGMAGLASAVSAADAGATVLLCEKGDEAEAGGNSRLCGQMFVWGDGPVQDIIDYYTALSAGREDPSEMIEAWSSYVVNSPDVIAEVANIDKADFVNQKTNVALVKFSPEYPELPGSQTLTTMSAHTGIGDGYLWRTLMNRIMNDFAGQADYWYSSPAKKLYQDPESKAIIGVAIERNGELRNVRALNGVCMCTGGFENNPKMVASYLNLVNYSTQGCNLNEGDGHIMCEEVGADMWHMSVYEGGGSSLLTGGYWTEEVGQRGCAIINAGKMNVNSGSMIEVGNWGRRFGNENEFLRHGHEDKHNGLWENVCPPERMWMLWDQKQMDVLTEANELKPDFTHTIVTCESLAAAAEIIGCPLENLQETVDRWNSFCEQGCDLEFWRDPETMLPLDDGTYYLMPVRPMLLNTQGGPRRSVNGEVIGKDGNPIPHLYSAGEFGGVTSCMYQGSTNVCECFVFGKLGGTLAAAPKDPLPPYRALPKVESTPTLAGAETDLVPAVDEDIEGALKGQGDGIGGTFSVYVVLDDDGAIESVTVGTNFESDQVGKLAFEQLKPLYVGLSTAEEIDAIDAVGGATVSSEALRSAVKQAMGL